MKKPAVLGLSLILSAAAWAVEPAPAVRGGGHFGIGFGGGTAVSGISGKYFLADAMALQFVVGGAGYGRDDFDSSLGVDVDVLWEMPALAHAAGAFELGWSAGVGGWAWVGDPFWLGANGIVGLEFNLEPIPLDIVLEYRPALRVVPDGLGFDLVDFGGHVRFYFG